MELADWPRNRPVAVHLVARSTPAAGAMWFASDLNFGT
jgi:hypothetical protein